MFDVEYGLCYNQAIFGKGKLKIA